MKICKLMTGLFVIFVITHVYSVANAQKLHLDPAKVTGPDACGECHKSSVAEWKDSHHFKTFKNLPRNKKARKIAKSMGIKLSLCELEQRGSAILEQR